MFKRRGTIIAEGLKIRGSVSAEGLVEVNGQIEGDVHCTSLFISDGLTAELVRSDEMRRKLAQRLLGFARLWWTDTQIKQLLLRTVRNQISVSQRAAAAGVEDTA